MPIIYGKRKNSTYLDLRVKMKHKWDVSLISNIVDICFDFWNAKYIRVNNFMKLIQKVSWITCKLGYNVIYGNNFYKTIQNYCKMTDDTLTVYYDTSRKKKSTVKVKEFTPIKDTGKTVTSTFANFIHQRDAVLIQNVMFQLCFDEYKTRMHIPIYTIHDNFLTTVTHAAKLPLYYRRGMMMFGHPLIIINKFLYDNLFARAINLGMTSESCANGIDAVYFDITRRIYDDIEGISDRRGLEIYDTLSYKIYETALKDYHRYASENNLSIEDQKTYLLWMGDALIKDNKRIFVYIIPDTLITSCLDYLIETLKMKSEKNTIQKNLKEVIASYNIYSNSLFHGKGDGSGYQYDHKLFDGEDYDEDYCIHH